MIMLLEDIIGSQTAVGAEDTVQLKHEGASNGPGVVDVSTVLPTFWFCINSCISRHPHL